MLQHSEKLSLNRKQMEIKDHIAKLTNFQSEKEFFVGIDSDGCVFDTMEIKIKECFCPQFIKYFNLQPVSKYARQVWEFCNLYSKTRGTNRFIMVVFALDCLAKRKEIKSRNFDVPKLNGLRQWIGRENKLGNPALRAEIERNPDPDLKQAYAWSIAVNKAVEEISQNIPPFPLVTESLKILDNKADVIVVSQTPCEALFGEWSEYDIDGYVRLIAGQEMGTKAEHISFATKGNYEPNKMLMLGDAPGDLKAAKANNALFFPIIPGREAESWQLFFNESVNKFFEGKYAGKYEADLIEQFDKSLPEELPW